MSSMHQAIIGLREMLRRRREGRCPFCDINMKGAVFNDVVSIKEFQITGLCQRCQDNFYGKEDER